MWPTIGSVPSYGVCYSTAFLIHYVVCWRIARHRGLRWWVWLSVNTVFAFGSIVGAKFLYDVTHSHLDWAGLISPAHYLEGGLWGGLLGYFVLAVPTVLLLTKNKRSGLDLVALSIPIPFLLGKLGCFLNGCCYGVATSLPWGVIYPQNTQGTPAGTPLHPTQIYEMLVMVCVILAFSKLRHHEVWRGTMIPWFLAIYGVGRAVCDSLRGDLAEQIHVGPVTLTQLLCVGSAAVSLSFLIWWRRKSASQSPEPLPSETHPDETTSATP